MALSLKMREQVVGRDHPSVAEALLHMSKVPLPTRTTAGHPSRCHADAEARRSVLTALPCATLVTDSHLLMREQVVGRDHPSVAEALLHMSKVLLPTS